MLISFLKTYSESRYYMNMAFYVVPVNDKRNLASCKHLQYLPNGYHVADVAKYHENMEH